MTVGQRCRVQGAGCRVQAVLTREGRYVGGWHVRGRDGWALRVYQGTREGEMSSDPDFLPPGIPPKIEAAPTAALGTK